MKRRVKVIKVSHQAAIDLAEMRTRIEERHQENQRRFDLQDEKLDSIEASVNSLLATRSFTKGVVKTVTLLATGIATVVSIIVGWVRG